MKELPNEKNELIDTQEKYRIKTLLKRSRIASKKKYMRQADRRQVLDGIMALQKLGIYDKPNWAGER